MQAYAYASTVKVKGSFGIFTVFPAETTFQIVCMLNKMRRLFKNAKLIKYKRYDKDRVHSWLMP